MAYEYNVPHVDFAEELNRNDGADAFFDIHVQLEEKLVLTHESIVEENRDCSTIVNISNLEETQDPLKTVNLTSEARSYNSPVDVSSLSENAEAGEASWDNSSLSQRSESDDKTSECSTSQTAVSDLKFTTVKDKGLKRNGCDVTKTNVQNSGVLKEISSNMQNIRNVPENKKRKSDACHGITKFISLAEGVLDFQGNMRDLKGNRVKGKKTAFPKCYVTIPQSPFLRSKNRSRPVDYPSAEDRIQKEVQEMKSFKLKANPVNKKILEPVQLGKKVLRAPLVVQPFNLTEYKKKEIEYTASPFHFKANPVPKGILEHPKGVPEKKALPITTPHTPTFMSKLKPDAKLQIIEEVDGKLVVKNMSPCHTNIHVPKVHLGNTQPAPFSFEERDKLMIKHREEKIKKVLEEEKEARNFHANPVPSYLKKIAKSSNESRSPSRCSVASVEEEKITFKAQPALVLQKPPFLLKTNEHSLTHPDNVILHTEMRANSRKQYDEYLKERSEAIEAELRKRRELEEKREQEEVARLRQQAVHKAQPIRSFKPLPEKPKAVITSPVTPNFSTRFKK